MGWAVGVTVWGAGFFGWWAVGWAVRVAMWQAGCQAGRGAPFWGFCVPVVSAVVSSREWFRFSLLQSSVIVSVAPLGGWLRGWGAV